MKIICLRSYSHGYTGFMDELGQYVFSQFPRQGKIKRLFAYDKSDFTGYRHFIGGISKFIPRLFFLERPVPVALMSIQELDSIFKEQYMARPEGVRTKRRCREAFSKGY